MSRYLRLAAALALVAGLAALAAFLMPAATPAATAQVPQNPNLNGYSEGLVLQTGCASDEIEITCAIVSDPCGRSFSSSGCCANDEIPSCAPIISSGNPTCWAGFAITCN